MTYLNPIMFAFISAVLSLILAACGGGGGGGGSGATYTIGSTLAGLNGGTLVLQQNGGDDLSLTANGGFVFATEVEAGATYDVSILTQPADQNCTVSNASGTVADSNIDNVSVDCIDAIAPTARIFYPPPISATEGNSIVVRGTASDSSEITLVRVNGIDATTSDNFATWQATVALAPGLNTLTVETGDIALNGETAAASASILVANPVVNVPDNLNPFGAPADVFIDSARNLALVLDSTLEAIIAVSLDDGARSVLSDGTTPDSSNAFSSPNYIIQDTAANRALVTDNGVGAVLAVDLDTGVRTILSGNGVPDSANLFSDPRGIVLDTANNRALVVDLDLQAIIAVDLVTGARSILSDNSTPDNVTPFASPTGIALDPDNNRALVMDITTNAMIAIQLDTGARSILSDSGTPDNIDTFFFAQFVKADSASGLAYVASNFNGIYQVELATGARQIISDGTTPDSNNTFSQILGLDLDLDNNTALVVDWRGDAVVAVDLVTGQRVILSRN